MLILRNATIMPVSHTPFVGDVAIIGKKIAKVAKTLDVRTEDRVYDMTNHFVTPGFIDAHTHIGMFEDGMGFEGSDGNEIGDPVTPELRALDAVNPFDRCFGDACQAGVTTVMTGPGSANVIGGQFILMNTHGVSADDMIFDAKPNNPAAMKAAFGENPKRVYNSLNKSPGTRMATASILRNALLRAREYMKKIEIAGDNAEKKPAFDFALESLIPVLHHEIPLKIHCHRADDILTAIRIMNEFDIQFTLDHCTEGYMITELLKPELSKNLRGIIIGPLLIDRGKIETKNLSFSSPRILDEAGIDFAMMTDCPVIPQQYLSVCMSIAVREGLREDTALRAITINPAKILNIDDKVGTIDEGKLANLAVFSGNPLDVRTRCRMTIIDGNIVHSEF